MSSVTRWDALRRRLRRVPPAGAMLACQDLVELVTDYLEHSLDPVTSHYVEDHLRACDACVAYLEQVSLTVTTLGRLPREDLTPELRAGLVATFHAWSSA